MKMHFNIYHVLTISVVVSAFPSLKSRSSHQTHICADIPGLMEADVIDSLDYSFTLVANLKDAPNKKLSFGFSNVDLQEPARFGPSTVFTLKASRLVEAGSRIPIVQSELRIFPPTVALYPGFILPFKVLTDGSHTFIEINHGNRAPLKASLEYVVIACR